MVKDCSYILFEEEINIGKFVIEDSKMKEYGDEIREEIGESNGTKNVGLDGYKKISSTSPSSSSSSSDINNILYELYSKSADNTNIVRNNGAYVLYGVVVHSGQSTGGHYFTYIQKRNNNKESSSLWWLLNDDVVKEVMWDEYEYYYFLCYDLLIC
jgi:hypothetical protein